MNNWRCGQTQETQGIWACGVQMRTDIRGTGEDMECGHLTALSLGMPRPDLYLDMTVVAAILMVYSKQLQAELSGR